MATPTSVVGCSTCGALYTPHPGDGRVCDACRVTVADDPAARPGPTPLFASEEEGGSRPQRGQTVRLRPRRSVMPRILKGALLTALIGGAAAGAYAKREELAHTWSWMRHHTVAEGWSMLEHRSSEAWIALRRHIPIDAIQPEPVKDDSAEASREAKTARRRQPGKSKRGRAEHAVAAK